MLAGAGAAERPPPEIIENNLRSLHAVYQGVRWWMVGLVTAGLIVNYLARNTLSVAAPSMMKDLNFGTAEYAHILVPWQVCYALMQPMAGYILDAIGTKLGFAIFALAWSLACAAAAFGTSWQSLAVFRGVLGATEAAGIPAGVKPTTERLPPRSGRWQSAGSKSARRSVRCSPRKSPASELRPRDCGAALRSNGSA